MTSTELPRGLARMVSLDDERALLAGSYRDTASLLLVRPHDFYLGAHVAICEAAQSALARSGAVTRETVRIELERRSAKTETIELAAALEREIPDLDGMPAVAARLRELACARDGHKAARAILAAYEEGNFDDAREHVAMLAAAGESSTLVRSRSFGEAMIDLTNSWARGPTNLCPLGVPDIDAVVGGLERDGSVCVFGARTHVGKSYFALTALDGMLTAGERPGLISVEDPERLWAARGLASATMIPAENIRRGKLTEPQKARALEGCELWRQRGGELVSVPGAPLSTVVASMAHLVREKGCTVLLVDYLQAMTADGRDERDRTNAKLAAMKGAAARLGVPWLLFSQLKRPDDPSKLWTEPSMMELKESGEIENRAEVILLGWRPSPTKAGQPQPPLIVRMAKVKGEPHAGGLSVLKRGPGWLWEAAPQSEREEWLSQIDAPQERAAPRKFNGVRV